MNSSRKILYINCLHGPSVVDERKIARNYNIAGTAKALAICEALISHGHEIVVYSFGSAAENSWRYYASSEETVNCRTGQLSITYGATLDTRWLRWLIEWFSLLYWLPRLIRIHEIQEVIVYNIGFVTCSAALIAHCLRVNVYLEYEDSAIVSRNSSPPVWKKFNHVYEYVFRQIVSGIFAPSEELLERIGVQNRLLLPGALSPDLTLLSYGENRDLYGCSCVRPLRLVYAGGLDVSKGVDRFLIAMDKLDLSLEIHIFGRGPLASTISQMCGKSRHDATFHGLVEREKLLYHLTQADVGINPHRSDLHHGGTWPFKVIEYLAACGTVFCNTSGTIPPELAEHLFLYHADEPDEIAKSFALFFAAWPEISKGSSLRQKWAIDTFGSSGIGRQLDRLLSSGSRTYGTVS